MRILIHSGNFYPEKTGIGKYTGEMAAWFAARGHNVSVITGYPYYPEWKLAPEYKSTAYREECWQNVRICRIPHYIPRDGRVTSVRRMMVDLSLIISSTWNWLRVLVCREKPHVIIAVCPPLLSGVLPCVVGAMRGIPVIYHVQDFQLDAAVNLGMVRPGLVTRVLGWLERRIVRSASRVSSITPAMCRRAAAKGAAQDRILEFPNWSDINAIRPIKGNTTFRSELNVHPNQMLVMYAGAMGRKQGLELVIDAARNLAADARFHFVMVGSGSDADELRKAAMAAGVKNMSFLPLQPVERLGEMLGSADVHLIVQRARAADLVMPSKLTNILAAGRPSVATAEVDTALFDTIVGANTGLAVPPGDVSALTQALLKLAADPGLRMELGRNARSYAELNLDRDAVLFRFENEMEQLVKSCG